MSNTKNTKLKPEVNSKKNLTTENAYRIFNGLKQISTCEIGDFNTVLKITENVEKLLPMAESYDKTLHTLKNKHIAKNDAGSFQVADKRYVFKSQKDEAEFEKAVEKLNNEIIDDNLHSIKISALKDAPGFKAAMLINCREVIIKDVDIEN